MIDLAAGNDLIISDNGSHRRWRGRRIDSVPRRNVRFIVVGKIDPSGIESRRVHPALMHVLDVFVTAFVKCDNLPTNFPLGNFAGLFASTYVHGFL